MTQQKRTKTNKKTVATATTKTVKSVIAPRMYSIWPSYAINTGKFQDFKFIEWTFIIQPYFIFIFFFSIC